MWIVFIGIIGIMVKGTVVPDLQFGSFLACKGRSWQEKEPLLVFRFFCCSFLDSHFTVLKHLISTLLGDFWNLRDGLTNVVLGDFLFPLENCWQGECKFSSEMNLQGINIIGDMLTNLADFFPFASVYRIRYYTV